MITNKLTRNSKTICNTFKYKFANNLNLVDEYGRKHILVLYPSSSPSFSSFYSCLYYSFSSHKKEPLNDTLRKANFIAYFNISNCKMFAHHSKSASNKYKIDNILTRIIKSNYEQQVYQLNNSYNNRRESTYYILLILQQYMPITKTKKKIDKGIDTTIDRIIGIEQQLEKFSTTEKSIFAKREKNFSNNRKSYHNIPIGANFDNKSSILLNKMDNILQVFNSSFNIITRFISTSTKNYKSSSASTQDEISNSESTSSEKLESSLLNMNCVKKIKVNACGELYKDLAKRIPHLYGNAPQEVGIDFEIEYYDNYEQLLSKTNKSDQLKHKIPIVCILHGAPGNYNEFSSLINYLTLKGIRVIAPNFPDYKATYEYSFRHSPKERLDLLENFFKLLKLKYIDLLIGHSSAVYTVFELLNKSINLANNDENSNKIPIKSIGLFSTPTYNLPKNLAVTPIRLFTLKLFDFPLLRPIVVNLIEIFAKFQGIRNRIDKNKIEDLLMAASAVGYSNCEKSADFLKTIVKLKIPTFILYGLKDTLIPPKSYEQLKRDFNIDSNSEVKCYNNNGDLIKDISIANEFVEVSEFLTGGHYVFQRFDKQVNEDVFNFLNRKVLLKVESTKL